MGSRAPPPPRGRLPRRGNRPVRSADRRNAGKPRACAFGNLGIAAQMNRKLVFALSAAAALGLAGPGRLGAAAESANWMESGRPWLDTDGNAIDAHSGGFLRVGD